MAGYTIAIKIRWKKVQTDLSECSVCFDVIYSGMWQLFISVNGGNQETNCKLCESCYDLECDQSGLN